MKDVTETPLGTSGMCSAKGMPKGAQVSELVWHWSGMPSGGKAWDDLLKKRRLLKGNRHAQPAQARGQKEAPDLPGQS
jgi:hypothetical protein